MSDAYKTTKAELIAALDALPDTIALHLIGADNAIIGILALSGVQSIEADESANPPMPAIGIVNFEIVSGE